MTLIHKLFYWNYNGNYILSKTKLISICEFILLCLFYLFTPIIDSPLGAEIIGELVVSALFSAITFCVGYIIHYVIGEPSEAKLKNNDKGFIEDIKNLLLFWQDSNTGEYTFSKTKAITIICIIVLMIISDSYQFAVIFLAPVFAVPIFIVGWVIHFYSDKKQIPHETTKQVKTENKVIKQPEVTVERKNTTLFVKYQKEIDKLKSEYSSKENNSRKLIEEKFTPPQLSYDKFMSVVDSSNKLFNHQYNSAQSIINLSSNESEDLENELKSKIDIMKTIISKLDDLNDELIISMSKSKSDDEDVHSLLDEYETLIDDVKNYE